MLTNLAIRNLTKNYLSEDCFKLIKVMSDNFKELQKDSNIKSIIKLANKIFSKDEGEYILCLAESLNWFKSIEDNIYQLSFYKNNIEFDLTLQRGIDLEINGLDFDIINKIFVPKGDLEEAKIRASSVLQDAPDFSVTEYTGSRPYTNSSDIEHLAEGMLLAGLPQ